MNCIEYPSEKKERGFGWSFGLPFLCEIISGQLTINGDAYRAEFFTNLPNDMVVEQKEFLTQHWEEIFSVIS